MTALLDNRVGGDVPFYAMNLERLHQTVKRARSVIEKRDTSIPVPEAEMYSILTKIQDLEKQVEGLLNLKGKPASAATGSSASTAPDSGDEDCDAENLMYDLGARAVVDSDGKVSGHPLFRRNANCAMVSAVKSKPGAPSGQKFPNASEAAGKGDPTSSSGDGDDPAAMANGRGKPSDAPGTSAAQSRFPKPPIKTSPAVLDAYDPSSKASAEAPEPNGSMSDDESPSAAAQPKGAAKGNGASDPAATGIPDSQKKVLSGNVRVVEVQTLPVDGKYITTTITKTTTRRTTVTLMLPHTSTNAAEKQKYQDEDDAGTFIYTTITKTMPDGSVVTEPVAAGTPAGNSAPMRASLNSDSFKKFSNDSASDKFAKIAAVSQRPEMGLPKEDKEKGEDYLPEDPPRNSPSHPRDSTQQMVCEQNCKTQISRLTGTTLPSARPSWICPPPCETSP